MRENVRESERLPARIGRYRLIGRLGKGGMADAYLALCGDLPGLRTLVVVKRMLPHLSSSEQYVRMFFDEARISALLDHPNIPRIIEVGHDEDGYFLAMEAVPGKPLSGILRRALRRKRPLGHAHAAFIVARAASGLAYAHALTDTDGRPLSIVHRDVSPQNILVSFDGAVKVIDFGIATAHGRVSQTFVGGLKGKVEYMSPEQSTGAPVDRRSDVFSLGIVLWESLTGRHLFRRDTDLAVMRAISDEPIPRPSSLVPIPSRLEDIVMTALERAPEDRFQDAHEMALLLDRFAFTTAGFDPAQLVTRVRRLFPADFAGWKATMGLAQSREGRSEREVTTTFLPLAALATGVNTVSLHNNPGADTSVAREAATRAFRSEPLGAPTGRPALSLHRWRANRAETGAEACEPSTTFGQGAAGYHGPGAWRRAAISGALLLAAGLASATVFVRLRANTAAPPSIVDVRPKTPGLPPLLEPLGPAVTAPSATEPRSMAQSDVVTEPPAPAPLPGVEPFAPTASPESPSTKSPARSVRRSSFQRPGRGVSRVVKVPARKHAPPHAATAPAKAQAGPPPVGASGTQPPTVSPPRRRPWTDPFE